MTGLTLSPRQTRLWLGVPSSQCSQWEDDWRPPTGTGMFSFVVPFSNQTSKIGKSTVCVQWMVMFWWQPVFHVWLYQTVICLHVVSHNPIWWNNTTFPTGSNHYRPRKPSILGVKSKLPSRGGDHFIGNASTTYEKKKKKNLVDRQK